MRTVCIAIAAAALSWACNNELSDEPEKVPVRKPEKVTKTESKSVKESRKTILFFGNSITAGYGLPSDKGFPSLIQQRLDSLNYPYRVVESGVNGETSRQGLRRIEKVLKENQVNILVIELGINDALSRVPYDETYRNLSGIIDKAREVYPNIQIILAGINPIRDEEGYYDKDFRRIFPRLAREKEVDLIPQLMGEVMGSDSLTLDDNLHPNTEGVKIVADNVWYVLEAHLENEQFHEDL